MTTPTQSQEKVTVGLDCVYEKKYTSCKATMIEYYTDRSYRVVWFDKVRKKVGIGKGYSSTHAKGYALTSWLYLMTDELKTLCSILQLLKPQTNLTEVYHIISEGVNYKKEQTKLVLLTTGEYNTLQLNRFTARENTKEDEEEDDDDETDNDDDDNEPAPVLPPTNTVTLNWVTEFEKFHFPGKATLSVYHKVLQDFYKRLLSEGIIQPDEAVENSIEV